ncbi:transposase [Collinsella tanakaei]|uniref:transposase n=1 Tax=Collinsella tanakaei TaxID=626935 RepID=UPI003A5227F9
MGRSSARRSATTRPRSPSGRSPSSHPRRSTSPASTASTSAASCAPSASTAPPAPANLPLREDGTHDFRAAAPNELWVTDITEFRLPCGAKCYPSTVIDCFDGRPVAWSIGRHPTARLANSSLEAACGTLAPGEAPAVHSDRGGHYRWPRWIAICEANGLARSMSRKGMSMSCVDVQ